MTFRLVLVATATCFVFSCALAADAQAAPNGPAFARYVTEPPAEACLQTAIVQYHGRRGVRVDLIAAVHVGDSGYYAALQRKFTRYDKLLFEMVKPLELDMATAGRAEGGVSGAQRWLKDLLDLEFQLDAVDYGPANFVHADMDSATLKRQLDGGMAGLLGAMVRMSLVDSVRLKRADGSLRMGGLALVAAFLSADRPRALKRVLARELIDLDTTLAALGDEGGPGGLLIARRNQVAAAVLKKTLAKGARRVGLFYGAAHLPDLDARLLKDFGLRRGATEWLCAWNLAPKTRPEVP